MDPKEIDTRISEIETLMYGADFWNDKNQAQALIKELGELKDKKEGVSKYDKGDAVLTILSGAGGDDAEDFTRMLLGMYEAFCKRKNFSMTQLSASPNDHGGYRSVSVLVSGKGAYGLLKYESGVHRLVRQSPFNADSKRQTSFSMVEIIPKIEKVDSLDIPSGDLRFELSKSSGPGGQNVNKRETAVRVVHIPTGLAVAADGERTQEANREHAIRLLYGKLIKKAEDEHKSLQESMQVSKTTDNEWGSQMRSYVLHPYKLVKDHRTSVETSNVDKVLSGGELDMFIEASQSGMVQ